MRTHSLADLPGALRDAADFLDHHGIKRFDRLFWHVVPMARFGPDVHFAMSYETTEPFRAGRCVILHLEPFRPGLVLGWYGKTGQEEHVALRRAVSLREPTQEELDDFDENVPQRPGLRFGATSSVGVRGHRPRPGAGAPGHDRADA